MTIPLPHDQDQRGELLASGNTADIYAWNAGQILKLFKPQFTLAAAEREARLTRAAVDAGIAAPAVGEVLLLDGRAGIVYERVDGMPMLAALLRRLYTLPALARQMADLHASLHACRNSALPDQYTRLQEKINCAARLSAAQKTRALAALQDLPRGDALCHGDFHPGNILVTPAQNGAMRAIVIDWLDATCGAPAADVGRTWLLLTLGARSPDDPLPLKALKRGLVAAFWAFYWRRYQRQTGLQWADVRRWLPVLAAARLEEGLREQEDALLNIAGQL